MLPKIIRSIAVIPLAMFTSQGYAADPFSIYPFEVPTKYAKDLKDYRTNWKRLTGFEYSGLHWQQFVVIYINKDAQIYSDNFKEYVKYYQDLDEYDEDELTVPEFKHYSEGTIVLKENFGADNGSPDVPLSVTMMIKREAGYDTENGDWEYVQFTPAGKVTLSGNSSNKAISAACSNCHINIAERDYIFTNFYSIGNEK